MATPSTSAARRRRGGSDDGVVDPALPQKKRARHRLVGAVALCLLAAILVPMLLESEPTPPSSELAIVIPSRETPLPPVQAGSAPPSTPEPAATVPKAASPKAAESVKGEPKGVVARGVIEPAASDASARPVGKEAAKEGARVAQGQDGPRVTEARTAEERAGRREATDEIGRLAQAAQARAKGEAGPRYLLQVGAYSAQAGANSAVERVQGVGLTAFTERIATDRGERLRVRVGPFPTREAAEQARARLTAAGIEAAVIAP